MCVHLYLPTYREYIWVYSRLFFFFLAGQILGLWDISYLTRDQTQAHGSESVAS